MSTTLHRNVGSERIRLALVSKGSKGRNVGYRTWSVSRKGGPIVGYVYRPLPGIIGAGRWEYSTRLDGNSMVRPAPNKSRTFLSAVRAVLDATR